MGSSNYQAAHAAGPRHSKPRSNTAVRLATAVAVVLAIITLGFGGYAVGTSVTHHAPVTITHVVPEHCGCTHAPPGHAPTPPAIGHAHPSAAALHAWHLAHVAHVLHMEHLVHIMNE